MLILGVCTVLKDAHGRYVESFSLFSPKATANAAVSRTTRHLELTDDGRSYYLRCQRLPS
jgi:hypothetical protein